MDQLNLVFVPDVLVIPVYSTVQFSNSDLFGHQVYSFSSAQLADAVHAHTFRDQQQGRRGNPHRRT